MCWRALIYLRLLRRRDTAERLVLTGRQRDLEEAGNVQRLLRYEDASLDLADFVLPVAGVNELVCECVCVYKRESYDFQISALCMRERARIRADLIAGTFRTFSETSECKRLPPHANVPRERERERKNPSREFFRVRSTRGGGDV